MAFLKSEHISKKGNKRRRDASDQEAR